VKGGTRIVQRDTAGAQEIDEQPTVEQRRAMLSP
jgi:hypothetical protein